MDNSDPLVPLGILSILVSGLAIVVPYLRRKSDAFTAWNFLLLGSMMFIGVGCLEVKYGHWGWPELQWFQPHKSDVLKFVLGTIVFYVALFVSYYYLKTPRNIAARVMNKWPPMTANFVFTILGACFAVAILATVAERVPILGAIFRNVSHKALVLAVVVSFCFWYKHKKQVVLLALFVVVFFFCALDSMVVYVGRRLLLSVVATPIVCLYWLNWRYRSIKANLFRLGVATMIALSTAAFYSTFRHFSKVSSFQGQRNLSTTFEAAKGASLQRAIEAVTRDVLHYFGQYTVHYSLLTIQLVDTGRVDVEPLNTLAFVVSYPVPRLLWPSKPDPLSGRIVKGVLNMRSGTNWGLGITAYGYQQGGIVVTALYAFLIVVLVRVIDDPLARQPDNVFLLFVLCASAPHLVAWIRGDAGVMTIEILESVVFAWGVGLVSRFFFGTAPAGPGRLPGPVRATQGYWRPVGS
jgi:hypothetical protein